ncbi:MAG: hypothetical protein Q7S32_04740 [bacterium]|nr:hypothetical protein [bacterium]
MKKTEEIKRLISLASTAKDIGEYTLANAIFVVLIDEKGAKWEWEDSGDNAYYDLAVVKYGRWKLCIPAPMLETTLALNFLKNAKVQERGDHDRVVEFASDEEVKKLWLEFRKLQPKMRKKELLKKVSNSLIGESRVTVLKAVKSYFPARLEKEIQVAVKIDKEGTEYISCPICQKEHRVLCSRDYRPPYGRCDGDNGLWIGSDPENVSGPRTNLIRLNY